MMNSVSQPVCGRCGARRGLLPRCDYCGAPAPPPVCRSRLLQQKIEEFERIKARRAAEKKHQICVVREECPEARRQREDQERRDAEFALQQQQYEEEEEQRRREQERLDAKFAMQQQEEMEVEQNRRLEQELLDAALVFPQSIRQDSNTKLSQYQLEAQEDTGQHQVESPGEEHVIRHGEETELLLQRQEAAETEEEKRRKIPRREFARCDTELTLYQQQGEAEAEAGRCNQECRDAELSRQEQQQAESTDTKSRREQERQDAELALRQEQEVAAEVERRREQERQDAELALRQQQEAAAEVARRREQERQDAELALRQQQEAAAEVARRREQEEQDAELALQQQKQEQQRDEEEAQRMIESLLRREEAQQERQRAAEEAQHERLLRSMLRREDAAAERAALAAIERDYGVALEEFECPICFDDVPVGEGIVLSCGHHLCGTCLEEAALNAIASHELLVCPAACEVGVVSRDVRLVCGGEAADAYAKLEQRAMMLKLPGLWHCPQPDCTYAGLQDEGTEEQRPVKVHCPQCKKDFCRSCRRGWHGGASCAEAAAMGEEDEVVEERLLTGTLRRCRCGAIIERNGGCAQITCICKRKFCFKCATFLEKKGDKCAHTHYH